MGHGAGARFLDGQSLLNLQMRAATLLFGCSSAALAAQGDQEGHGIILNYLMAGWWDKWSRFKPLQRGPFKFPIVLCLSSLWWSQTSAALCLIVQSHIMILRFLFFHQSLYLGEPVGCDRSGHGPIHQSLVGVLVFRRAGSSPAAFYGPITTSYLFETSSWSCSYCLWITSPSALVGLFV